MQICRTGIVFIQIGTRYRTTWTTNVSLINEGSLIFYPDFKTSTNQPENMRLPYRILSDFTDGLLDLQLLDEIKCTS